MLCPLREASLCHAKGLISLQPVLPMCPPPSWPGRQDVIYIPVSLALGVEPGLVFNDQSSSIPEAGARSTCKEVTDTPHCHLGLVTAVYSWGDSSKQLEASET